jgi:hypothetical protein
MSLTSYGLWPGVSDRWSSVVQSVRPGSKRPTHHPKNDVPEPLYRHEGLRKIISHENALVEGERFMKMYLVRSTSKAARCRLRALSHNWALDSDPLVRPERLRLPDCAQRRDHITHLEGRGIRPRPAQTRQASGLPGLHRASPFSLCSERCFGRSDSGGRPLHSYPPLLAVLFGGIRHPPGLAVPDRRLRQLHP